MGPVNPWLPGFKPKAQHHVRASLYQGDLRGLLEGERLASPASQRKGLTTRTKKRRRHQANQRAKRGIPAALKILGRDAGKEEPEAASQEELPLAVDLQEEDNKGQEPAQHQTHDEEEDQEATHHQESEREEAVEANPQDEEILMVNGQILTQEPGTLVYVGRLVGILDWAGLGWAGLGWAGLGWAIGQKPNSAQDRQNFPGVGNPAPTSCKRVRYCNMTCPDDEVQKPWGKAKDKCERSKWRNAIFCLNIAFLLFVAAQQLFFFLTLSKIFPVNRKKNG